MDQMFCFLSDYKSLQFTSLLTAIIIMDGTQRNQSNESNNDSRGFQNTSDPSNWSLHDVMSILARGESNTSTPSLQSELMTAAQAFEVVRLARQMATEDNLFPANNSNPRVQPWSTRANE